MFRAAHAIAFRQKTVIECMGFFQIPMGLSYWKRYPIVRGFEAGCENACFGITVLRAFSV